MNLIFRTHNSLRGFTLTEIAIVLGVVGVMIGAIWSGSASVSRSNKINAAVRELQVISANIRSVYSLKHQFSQTTATDITCSLVNAGVFPTEMLMPVTCVPGTPATYPLNAWGTPGVIVTAAANDDPTSFYIDFVTWNDTPQPCQALLGTVVSSPIDGLTAVWTNAITGAYSDNSIPVTSSLDVTSFTGCQNAAFKFTLF